MSTKTKVYFMSKGKLGMALVETGDIALAIKTVKEQIGVKTALALVK